MQIRLTWQTAVLVCALAALAATAVSARPQGQIALVHDAQGRALYVNAAELVRSERDSIPGALPLRSPAPGLHELMSQTAQSLGVDLKLVEAVAKVESGYDVRARSPKGAVGLMQLMPATAARFGVDDPLDAAQNVRGGVTYLAHLLRQFSGDVPLSLAAYNAGEGAVLRERGIPQFRETRDYVRKVIALYPSSFEKVPLERQRQRSASLNQVVNPMSMPDNAPKPIPIYRYVDVQGVVHFSQ